MPSDRAQPAVAVDLTALPRAASALDRLTSRVTEFERAAAQASGSLAGTHPWGLLGEVYLRQHCTSMMNGFSEHLPRMREAMTGARDRLRSSGHGYSAVEQDCLDMLVSVGDGGQSAGGALRQLNPASQFYVNHRDLNGMITALPYPLGSLGSSALDGVRFIGDLTSGDQYNVSTDLANFGADAVQAAFQAPMALIFLTANPLSYLLNTGIGFLLNAFYWTKYVADWVTGDPIATGQAAYNYDSVAQGCHRLARDLTAALNTGLGNGKWQGAAADAARARLTALRDGIDATGRNADQIASLLQLTSSMMGAVEGIVRGTVASAISWAVECWLVAQLVAPTTGGASEVAAVAQIYGKSADTATMLSGLIRRVGALLQRISAVFKRVLGALKDCEERAFTALRKSSLGEKYLNHKSGGQQILAWIRQDNGLGKHAAIESGDLLRTNWIYTRRLPKLYLYKEYGFSKYRVDNDGVLYADGRQQLSPVRYLVNPKNPDRLTPNYAGVVFYAARSLLPFGRAVQYMSRGEGTPSSATIDQDLRFWEAN